MEYIKTKDELNKFFTEEYYNSINYTDYTSRMDKYNKTADELYDYLNMSSDDKILDYGCAVGMLLNGFLNKGMYNLNGFDISEWAVSHPINSTLNLSTNFDVVSEDYTHTFALDVFEHMFDSDVSLVLTKLNTNNLIVRIPVKVMGDSDFYLEVSRRDKSHINCKTKGEWIDYIESYGFRFDTNLSLNSIYDSKGCFCGVFIRE